MGLLAKLKNSLRRGTLQADAADELAWHMEQRTNEYLAQGMSVEEARAAARKRLGNLTSLQEKTAESDLIVWLDALKRDLRLALRMLLRARIVTMVAILSLALGIGANAVVFTLMKQVVLDYLPVPEPSQLMILHSQDPESGHTWGNGMQSSFSYPLYQDLNGATPGIFQGILALRGLSVSMAGPEATEMISGNLVSGNFFDVLKVTPWRGRLFTATDDQRPGSNPVVVLGYGLWQRAFGGEASVVGRTVLLNQHPYLVVGVTPPQFYGIDVSSRADLYLPISMKDELEHDKRKLSDRLDHWCSLMGRLKPGISARQASAALSVIYPALRDQDLGFMKSPSASFKKLFAQKKILLSPGGKGYADLRDQLSDPLKILMAMVGIVLFITVVNVANLLVARGVSRQREMAIRLSVGAGKVVLVRQLLIESVVLALAGGALGVIVAYSCTPLLLHFLSFDLSSASISARPDWHVVLFAGAVTLLAGVAFGLLPAWQSTRTDVASILKAEGSWGNTGHSFWLRRGLVVGQVALSLILVTAAMLFTRSLQNLKNIAVGFDTANLVKFQLNPLQAGYSEQRIKTFGETLRQNLTELPGAVSASISTIPVLQDMDEGGNVTVEGAPTPTEQDDNASGYNKNLVSPAYFSGMRIPLRAGREFSESDSQPTSKVAVVNETFVKRYFAGKDPIGMHFGFGSGHAPFDYAIVGVVADSKHSEIRSKVVPFVYLPYLASDELASLSFYVRVRPGMESSAMQSIRGLVRRLDPSLPVNELAPLSEVVDESLFVERCLGFLSLGFAVLATLLAIVGLYGVMSYSVNQRQRELGIRMAIGASRQRVITMVLRESGILGVVGVVCAVPCVFGTARYLQSALYGVKPNDPAVWCSAGALLVAVALLAGFAPAWRAAHIDPNAALRDQ